MSFGGIIFDILYLQIYKIIQKIKQIGTQLNTLMLEVINGGFIMKKIILSAISIILMFSMVSCGSSSTVENTSVQNNTTAQSNVNSTTENITQTTSDIDLIYTFEDPGYPIVFDYPEMKCIEEATSQIFKRGNFVISYCRDKKTCDINDITTELAKEYADATDHHILGDSESFDIKETKEMTINGVKVLRIDGNLVSVYDSGDKVMLPMRGYTFAKGENICELIAVLNKSEPNAEEKAEMDKTIDAMIQTLREDR